MSESGHGRETGATPDGATGGDASAGDEPRSVETPALAVRDLRKRFGGVTALDGATLDVADGEVVCLVGPNGAGKSTLFDCVTGVHDVDDGRVLLDGADVTDASTAEVVQRGLSRTFQAARTFPELTVRENMIANQAHADESVLRTAVTPTAEATMARIEELVAFLDIDHLIDEPAGSLSTGQKKLLSVVATLLREPSVVLLDEPTAGVNPALVDEIVGAVLDLNDRDTTFLIVEHDMDVVRELADHVYVLANGTNLVDAPPATALDDPRVLRAYFGE